VSFTLRSDNPDGTVQTYQGTDTITGGRITAANIVQTGRPHAQDRTVPADLNRPSLRNHRAAEWNLR